MTKGPLLILLGPTCVGKTGASLLLARALDTEIISADSMQIYRHMDIGTAKPTPQERAQVRHHMIDIVAPSESFSTGKYIESIVPIINDLHRKKMTPLIVGGTGLYIKAMTRGIFSGPAADWALRENLLAMENESSGSLYAYLQKLDLAAASRIMPSDIRRIIRALEVCIKTQTGISEHQKRRTAPLPYEFIKIGLTRERGELYGLIEKRIDSMLSQGLMDEVKRLLLMNPGKTALQAIGYKEIAAHFRGEYPLDEAARLIKKRTRNYAKRQFTWFKAEPDIRWLDITGFSTPEEIQRAIAILLKMH
ncbi:MAG: tRNA (adenosine(37)-N6)-dimethylallyltransferase MiaA [Thermodesulfovibrionales bacterium]|jgi:tRNA dimethylallyltransferase